MAREIILPKLGADMTSGTITDWFADEGEGIKKGEPLLEISVDTMRIEVEAESSGFLLKKIGKKDESYPVFAVIGYLGEEGEKLPQMPIQKSAEEWNAYDQPVDKNRKVTNLSSRDLGESEKEMNPGEDSLKEDREKTMEEKQENIQEETKENRKVKKEEILVKGKSAEAGDPRIGKVKATPAARRLARTYNVDIQKIRGSGLGGRIQIEDVKKVAVIPPGHPTYNLKKPVVIGIAMEEIMGNPENVVSISSIKDSTKLEKIEALNEKTNHKTEKVPNPELDFVSFVEDEEKPEVHHVSRKVSPLDFVPFVEGEVQPLREEIIVKPVPIYPPEQTENQNAAPESREPEITAPEDPKTEKTETEKTETAKTEPENTKAENVETQKPEPESREPENIQIAKTERKNIETTKTEQENTKPENTELKDPETENPQIKRDETKNSESVALKTQPATTEEKLEDQTTLPEKGETLPETMAKSSRDTGVITLTTEIDMTEVKDLRKKIGKKIEDQVNYRCTYTDFLLLATTRSLIKHPLINSSLENSETVAHHCVHMGLAVGTDNGFSFPVIKNIHEMSLTEVVKSRGDLLKAVKNRQFVKADLQGSTFTMMNLGMYGIRDFTAMINQPNSAMLSVGEVVQRVRVHHGEPVVRSVMKISLNLDHRAADSMEGAKFLQDVRADMENPSLLLF